MNQSSPLRLERRDGVAILTLCRPDRLNALSREAVLAFGRAGRELERDPAIRAVVLTGEGDRAFCAGADLKERRTMDEDAVREQLRLYRSELGWLEPFRAPVVAAINGLALGGGLELALLCDLRVAAEHAVLGLPETSLGIIPGSGGTQRLPRLVGEARAKEMILLGRRLSAGEALSVGLVNRVIAAGATVLEDTLEWIRPIRQGAPVALSAALRAVDAAGTLALAEGLEEETRLYEECLTTEDRREALEAFTEKRPPIYKGR